MADTKSGIFVAKPGENINGQLQYDSTVDHMKINLVQRPKLFDIVTMSAGSNTTVSYGAQATETLFFLSHGLGYKPTVWVYYFVYAVGASPATGSYATGNYIIAGGVVIDEINYEVTDTTFSVFHYIDNSIAFIPGPYTSTAADYTLRLKYYILNNPASNTFVNLGNTDIFITG